MQNIYLLDTTRNSKGRRTSSSGALGKRSAPSSSNGSVVKKRGFNADGGGGNNAGGTHMDNNNSNNGERSNNNNNNNNNSSNATSSTTTTTSVTKSDYHFELVKTPRRRDGGKDGEWVINQYSKKKFNLSNGMPVPGGFLFQINGKGYAFSTQELGLTAVKKKKMERCPAQLNLERTTKCQQIELWSYVQKTFQLSLLKNPTTYGKHHQTLGNEAKEIFLGCGKERKTHGYTGITNLTVQNYELVKAILGSLPNTAKLFYPRVGIVYNATTKPHLDKLRCQFPQYIRILRGAATDTEYGLKVDERLYFGKTVLKLNENTIAIPMTYQESNFATEEDKDIRCAKFCNYTYVGMIVLRYDPVYYFFEVLKKRVGNLNGITLICGSQKKIRYFQDNDIIEDVKDLHYLNEEILRHAMKNLLKQKGKIMLYGKLSQWQKFYPMRYLHWWHGDPSAVRVYIINVSLRTGVGMHSLLHV